MSVKIRLSRLGRRKRPAYRVVVADSKSPRDGKCIEDLGYYNPMFPHDDPRRLSLDMNRIKYWISVGAQQTERVGKLHAVAAKQSAAQ